ncbi:uncharacterized protein [Nicotiana sylvestris]|uniref:uncharacterized protein n=1 Tax=Nicotiana sylvestris TaxID=4096 RepID=UPI00388CC59C
MSVITWNVRGFNKAYKQKKTKEFIKQNKKAVITLVEHRIKEQKATGITNKIAPGWQWISNFSSNNKSRIWILWDPRIFEFEPIDIDCQYIHGQVRTHSRLLAFGFTTIYFLYTIKDTLSMWQKLRQINSIQQGPWLAMGDFNSVLNSQDRQHGTIIQDVETKDFREFMSDTSMNELPTMGRDYTWTNNHTYSRIDRGLVNINWMMTMPDLCIQILEPSFSNHSPLKLMISQMRRKKDKQVWNTNGDTGKLQGVWNKLKRVKQVIKGLNTQHYKGVEDRIKETIRELQEVQEKIGCKMMNTELIEEEKELKKNLEKWILIEESIYRQRSRYSG